MAEWSTAYVNDLPDSAFACPEQRKYPHHDASGKLDLPHLRAALSRVGDPSNEQCGKAHLEAHAKAEGMGERKSAGKATMHDLKAQLIDESHFRILAIPFGGPIQGGDLDGERFTPRTDIKPDWFPERPVLWHHGQDTFMGDRVIGKATDLKLEEDGWWVDVWLKRGQKHAELVQKLAQKSPLYGSSGTIGYLKRTAPDGEILVWPYAEQTLTLTPSNQFSISAPAKAMFEHFASADIDPVPGMKAVLDSLDNLGADLPLTSHPDGDAGDVAAKAGRVSPVRLQALREWSPFLDRIVELRSTPEPPD